MSWSYPAKGNLITTHQFFKDLKASKDREAIEVGDNVLREKGMMGIKQESLKARPIKCPYVIFVLRSVEGQIIDTLDSDYGEIGTSDYTISSAQPPQGRWRRPVLWSTKAGLSRER